MKSQMCVYEMLNLLLSGFKCNLRGCCAGTALTWPYIKYGQLMVAHQHFHMQRLRLFYDPSQLKHLQSSLGPQFYSSEAKIIFFHLTSLALFCVGGETPEFSTEDSPGAITCTCHTSASPSTGTSPGQPPHLLHIC